MLVPKRLINFQGIIIVNFRSLFTVKFRILLRIKFGSSLRKFKSSFQNSFSLAVSPSPFHLSSFSYETSPRTTELVIISFYGGPLSVF